MLKEHLHKCKDCKYLEFNSSLKKKRCFLIGGTEDTNNEVLCFTFKKATNADRIRAMSDEELAEFLDDIAYYCKGRQNETYCSNCRFYFLGECNCISIGEWLKSEVGCE